MKIIIGANGTTQPGWLSLERSQLDLRERDTWARFFRPGSVDAVLSEHVLEHLTPEEASWAARNVYEFLRPGGYWRIAVPDANNPSKWCQLCNRPVKGCLLCSARNIFLKNRFAAETSRLALDMNSKVWPVEAQSDPQFGSHSSD